MQDMTKELEVYGKLDIIKIDKAVKLLGIFGFDFTDNR